MFKAVFEELGREVSGDIALGFVSEITRHHRIQGSPGFRAAVEYVVETLKGYGLEAEVKRYPADGESYAWSCLLFREWWCHDAELWLREPESEKRPLARWSESKLSLIQRSYPTPPEGVEAEVVHVGKGEEPRDYRGLDVEGRIVLTDGRVSRVYELAVEERGAIGIIYYGMRLFPPVRREGDLDDALQYTSFWWSYESKPCFGFVLSPRRGRWLRDLISKQRRKGKTVKVWARVDAGFKRGSLEVGEAWIEGEGEGEVIIVAHICHPQPSANDNASGCAAAMEAARTLRKLIAEGRLKRPRRTIRFLFVPEMTGTYAWLAENEDRIGGMVAALNLDMVGEKQELCGSTLILEWTPDASASYVNPLLEAILDELKGEFKNLSGTAAYPLYRWTSTPFSGGSDHYIFSDPSVGVPCPMIIQWPDRFYHTSLDTIDKVDPKMLGRTALMAATYAYFIASAGRVEAIWMMEETVNKYRRRILERGQRGLTKALSEAESSKKPERVLAEALERVRRELLYEAERGIEALESIGRLGVELDEKAMERCRKALRDTAKGEAKRIEEVIRDYASERGLRMRRIRRRKRRIEIEADAIRPKRRFRGPISIGPWLRKLPREDREAYWRLNKKYRESQIQGILAQYWADGHRSLLEIARLIEIEIGRCDLQYLMELFRLYEKMGLVTLR
ncbi:DUF4910 domain-containing protein [Candidatus Bathyarchaeota archaeon]|nr:DUF4910 domain-containing protein [Candidatus Bathyarchaeota archaeon]